MGRFLSLVVTTLIFTIYISASVDIVLKSFDTPEKAERGFDRLEKFMKDKNLTVDIRIKEMNGLYYLEVGTFSESVRDDEGLLALFALQYPDMMIVQQNRERSKNVRKNLYKAGQQKREESFWSRYESIIQWMIISVMTLWGAFIIYLRAKTMRSVSKEQTLITEGQSSMELTLDTNEKGREERELEKGKSVKEEREDEK
jgi:hypothetical protein